MIKVTQEVYDGIVAVRNSGQTNMFARDAVAAFCMIMGYDEAYDWIYEHKGEYSTGILSGFEVGE